MVGKLIKLSYFLNNCAACFQLSIVNEKGDGEPIVIFTNTGEEGDETINADIEKGVDRTSLLTMANGHADIEDSGMSTRQPSPEDYPPDIVGDGTFFNKSTLTFCLFESF